ncbi:MAG: PQQ-binding-like beta-propeller repeat protein [Verrucomicrobiia bacterium]
MKIQCACGAKYAFDVTPEMAENPVRFVCQNCGLDSSDYVNGLIRQELGLGTPVIAPPPPAPSIPVATPRLQVAHAAEPSGPAAEIAAGSQAPQFCLKHRGELCTEHCVVCQKPICPKCMELFGYVCSPLCKARAEAKKIKVPVYAGQKTVVEAQFWRKTGKISSAIAAVVVALLGFWFWYAWFGSIPHPIFSVRFTSVAHSGQSRLCGNNQIVFLHGGTLARYDLRSKKEIWSHQLIDPQLIKDAVAKASGDRQTVAGLGKMDMNQFIERGMEEGLQLQVGGSNVWVSSPDTLTHYDWDTGKVLQEIPLAGGFGEMASQGGELLMMGRSESGQPLIMQVNLATGESHTEEIGPAGKSAVAMARNASGTMAVASAGGAASSPAAGLPLVPGASAGRPLNPGKVAEQAQSLPLPARIALPALLASSMHQERIMQEANDESDDSRPRPPRGASASPTTNQFQSVERYSLIPSQYGFVQFSTRLLESRIVTREAMKAPPARSALDSGNLNVTRTADVANEILNEMQRNRGGGTVEEDESRYQVAIRRPDSTGAADWTGEVIGPPALFPLKTVNVLTAGKTITVFDKTNKKLWQAALAYSVLNGAGAFGAGAFGGENTQFGEGPCVERGDSLYVFDQAVLTAFDVATGNVRWRLPSVGVVGLFFDDKGMMYVNSTTASPENIKYSRQIDINQKTEAILLKIDPQTGKTLWSVKPGGFISYLSGKYIYAVYIHQSDEDEEAGAALAGITPHPPFIHIRRLNPRNGEVMWDYYQERAPLNVQFNGNVIQLVFKKEVQVLKFFSL